MKYCLFLLYVLVPMLSCARSQQAVVIVPIADLVGEPFDEQNAEQQFQKIPLCGGYTNPFIACPRVHQLLFNEVVTIIGQNNNQYKIAIPHCFCITAQNSTPQNVFWVLKSALLPFSVLKAHNIDLKKIPAPISWHHKTNGADESVCALCIPFKDPTTGWNFSAGTRFTYDTQHKNDTTLTVFICNKDSLIMDTLAIPKQFLIIPGITPNQKIKNFVELLGKWAHLPHGMIRYVWGGTSILNTSSSTTLKEEFSYVNNKKSSYFAVDDCQDKIKSGLDCAGMIVRAAQICGIPFFYKNTTTIERYLKPITQENPLRLGDIIWIDRHVMVVADMQKNTIFEARGYTHGYGKVQEIELKKVFKDINSFTDLKNAYDTKKPLIRLDIHGVERDIFATFKLLSMASVY